MFVAMQQNSATLIYDSNKMKGTVESYSIVIQNSTVLSRKIAPICKSLKRLFLATFAFLSNRQFLSLPVLL